MFETISKEKAKALIEEKKNDVKFQIIDVRTPDEFRAGALPGAKNIDIYNQSFREELNKLDKDGTYLLYCRSGARSSSAMEIMRQLGFKEVCDLGGGLMNF
jgi:rhodanese-related sulfurtransferase